MIEWPINSLKLYPLKTELIWLASSQEIIQFEKIKIKISQVTINPATSAKSLGAVLDDDLNLLV